MWDWCGILVVDAKEFYTKFASRWDKVLGFPLLTLIILRDPMRVDIWLSDLMHYFTKFIA